MKKMKKMCLSASLLLLTLSLGMPLAQAEQDFQIDDPVVSDANQDDDYYTQLQQANKPLLAKHRVAVASPKTLEPNFKTLPKAFYYRTRIRDTMKEGVSFAGHYSLASWGCGTNCHGIAITDTITGKILFYKPMLTIGDLNPKDKNAKDVVPLGSYFSDDSNLFIINPLYGEGPDELKERLDTAYGAAGLPRYYIWENNQFKEVSIENFSKPNAQ